MRALLIFGGVMLMLLAISGAVCWVNGFEMLQEILINGAPIFFDHGGRQIELPGRLVGALALTVPIVCLIGGIWLLRLAFDRDDERNT